jgi:hypothetical protein
VPATGFFAGLLVIHRFQPVLGLLVVQIALVHPGGNK